METFIERLKKIRGDMTQEEFAEMLNLKKQSIQQYEKGIMPKKNFFENIKKVFGVNLNWLIAGEGGMYTNTKENNTVELISKLKKEIISKDKQLRNIKDALGVKEISLIHKPKNPDVVIKLKKRGTKNDSNISEG